MCYRFWYQLWRINISAAYVYFLKDLESLAFHIIMKNKRYFAISRTLVTFSMEIVERQTSIAWRSTICIPINVNYGCIMYSNPVPVSVYWRDKDRRPRTLPYRQSVELGRKKILMRAHSLSREISVAVG